MSDHKALLRLSWPPKPLRPNSKPHWGAKSRAVAKYKEEAWAKALEQGVKRIETDRPRLKFTFHPQKNGRLPDIHNMPATQKATIDGIAAAMGCDDAGFQCVWPDKFGHRVDGGCVLIEIVGAE